MAPTFHLKNETTHLSSKKDDIENFNPQVFVAGCVVCAGNKILLLQNKDPDSGRHLWGVPGGKLNLNEPPDVGVIREVEEETGILLNEASLQFVVKLHVRIPKADYEFYTYKTDLGSQPEELHIKLDQNEHQDYKWVTPEEAMDMDLIFGGRELINYIYA